MKLWGGRFNKATDKSVNDFNSSIRFDGRLYKQDIEVLSPMPKCSAKAGIIGKEDADIIAKELAVILA